MTPPAPEKKAAPIASPAVSSCSTCAPVERETSLNRWFDEVIDSSSDYDLAEDDDEECPFEDATDEDATGEEPFQKAVQWDHASDTKEDLGSLSLVMAILWCILTLLWSGCTRGWP